MRFTPSTWFQRRAYRGVWSDPARKVRTLESFAQTEADGGNEIRAAVSFARNDALKGHLARHADDEVRHANMFTQRAAELRAAGVGGPVGDETSDRAFDMERSRGDGLDFHGDLSGSPIDEIGEIPYVAKLHVAECRAAELFAIHSSLLDDDPETKKVFDDILVDEKYHMGYTNHLLREWRKEGRASEVKSALKSARESRFLGAWKRLGIRSAGGFGRVTMFLAYYTLAVPFALVAKRGRLAVGWQDPVDRAEPDAIRQQY